MVEADDHETPIHAETQEDINSLLEDGYKVNYERLTTPQNKSIARGDT